MTSPMRDIKHVAGVLGVTVSAVYRLVAERRIATVKLGQGRGGALRFLDEDIDAFVESRRRPARAPEPPTRDVPRVPRRAPAPPRTTLALPGADRYVT